MTEFKHDISFVRLRLFAFFVLTAFYSLVNPKRCLQMLDDYNTAEAERQKAEIKDRILRIKERHKKGSLVDEQNS